ncbi:7253_t:CDS:2, partial [Funneliformis geosporum]
SAKALDMSKLRADITWNNRSKSEELEEEDLFNLEEDLNHLEEFGKYLDG